MRKVLLALIVLVAISTGVYAQNGTTPTDPCAGVTCSSPPAAECDGSSVKTYSSSGTCSNGQCSYSSSTAPCRFGCSLGSCKACEPGACGTDSRTCADGFVATCQQSCGGDACLSCEPSCAGHEATNTTQIPQLTITPTSSNCTDSDGGQNYYSSGTVKYNLNFEQQYQYQYTLTDSCSGSTLNEYYCDELGNAQTAYYTCMEGCSNGMCKKTICPAVCVPMWEIKDGRCAYNECGSGCGPDYQASFRTEDECKARLGQCGNNICEPGEASYCTVCVTAHCPDSPCYEGTCLQDCPAAQPQCPAGCECKYDSSGNIIASYCQSQPQCNYNGVCDKGEDVSCKDCIGATCPLNYKCPDGSTVSCYRGEFGCSCDPCPVPASELPPGCRQEIDNTGFIRVICEPRQVCQSISQEVRLKCVDGGGTPMFGKGADGCDAFQCNFGGQRTQSPVFASPVMCPSPEEVSHSIKKCEELGMPGFIDFEGGCKIGKCAQKPQQACRYTSEEERRDVEKRCMEHGQKLIFEYDQNGCRTIRCSEQAECMQNMPKEAYDTCAEKGGQLVVKRDASGCVAFTNCIRRGDTSESFVEDVRNVPDTTELLAIAFKLEDLKLELDKLARRTDDIADYYKSTGSSEEKRFRRVADMFLAAKGKVDEIREKLRSRANDISVDDVLEIKQDIRYLKDVVIKDILFVMLSSDEDIESIKSDSSRDCGIDGSCFDRAIRVCQPITFRPEGSSGPIVEIKGLEGDSCIMYVVMLEGTGPPAGEVPGINPPYEMTCKIQKYSLGIRNPEMDMFPYCTGNMVELIKKYGIGSDSGGGPPGVPGKCSGDECRQYCGRGPTEARECLQYLGDMLPPEAKEHLTALAEGRSPGGGGFRGDFNEGEFENEFESGSGFRSEFDGDQSGGLCGDGFCDDFEQRNPGACSRDCLYAATPTTAAGPGTGGGACSGCLNNGVCDPGECDGCADCLGG